ncbi:TPA: glycosyltransferase family 1 protein [Pseudomonas aeruginosa]|nr:glycosyltransferase family 1 protein [Pseudomonas aeruginosa]
MKVLFLVQKEQRAILDRLYDGIAAHCECDTRWLSSEEQADLRGYFRKHVDVSRYDRIRFFVSADVGMGEYMIKNFEAMACGCVLLAYDQGERENEALGFRDMENIVLYRSVADIQEKLAILRLDTALAERIARSGQALAIERFSFAAVGQSIVEAMRPALREPERPGWLEKTWRRIFT